MGTPKFVASWSELWAARDPKVHLVSEVGASLWRTEPFTGGVCTNFEWLVPELNCSMLVGVRIVSIRTVH